MVRALLIRGMIAGLLAGLLSVGFAEIFGEEPLVRAIAFEAAEHHADHGMTAEPEPVSRGVQSTIGLATAGIVYGVGLGGIFALVFAFAHGRGGPASPRELALLLAGLGFVAIVLAPQLKYPANPPSIGEPGTIGERTALYFEMIAVSLSALVLAVLAFARFRPRLGGWNAALVAGAVFVAVTGFAALLLPTVDEVPENFPAVVLWRFRVAALGMQLVLWGSLGLVFGTLAERALASTGRRVRSPA
ncbi:MAG TPA: CbtA family protein [Stellaceae bacterium]|nr:CbtA family protein [Stellaceae bacterium]